MVWYIRFLNTIRELAIHKVSYIDFVITITTDLGEEFYPADIDIHIYAVAKDETKQHARNFLWRAGMRVLPIRVPWDSTWTKALALEVSTSSSGGIDTLQENHMPEIVGARNNFLREGSRARTYIHVERVFSLDEGSQLRVWEEIGESIARHIWDAGIALSAYIHGLMSREPRSNGDMSPLKKLLLHSTIKPLNVLELGSGCGIVGIALSQLVPSCNVLLTDLSEAMDILDINIRESRLQMGSKIEAIQLDWDDELPASISKQKFDLILVSDCTYNADSLPSLVQTVSILTSLSNDAHVIVSMKVRHDSEAVFFELMSNAGLESVRHDTVELPDRTRKDIGIPLDRIEIYDFQLQVHPSQSRPD